MLEEIITKVQQQDQEQVRRVVQSVIVGGGYGFAFSEGDVWRIPARCTIPDALRLHSEQYDGVVPHDAKVFDAEEFEKLTRPRAEPPAPSYLPAREIQRRFNWSVEQLSLSKQCGFPMPWGSRAGEPIRAESAIDAWVGTMRALAIKP